MPVPIVGVDWAVVLRDSAGAFFGTGSNPVNVMSMGGGGGGASFTDEAAWTAGSTAFNPGGGVFNDSAAALTSGQQGTVRLTAQRGLHAQLRTTAGTDALLTNNGAAPASLTNLGVLPVLANAAAPSWTEGRQVLASSDLAGNLRAIVQGQQAAGAAITENPVLIAGQNAGNVKLMSLSSGGAILLQGTLSNNNAAPGADFVENLGALANAASPSWTEGNMTALSTDLTGRMRVRGTMGNNAGAPGTDNQGFLGAIANAAAPSWTEGRQVLQSVDLAGNLRSVAQGDVAHGASDSGNPVKHGAVAIAHGTNPTAVTAAQRTNLYASRAGIPFFIGGHPNIQTIRVNYTSAQTDTAIITVSTGAKIVVTGFLVTADNANTVNTSVRLGFGTAATPTGSQVIGSHPGIAAGSGFGRGGGSGIIGVGADNEDLRITSSVPTSGSIDVDISWYTIES